MLHYLQHLSSNATIFDANAATNKNFKLIYKTNRLMLC